MHARCLKQDLANTWQQFWTDSPVSMNCESVYFDCNSSLGNVFGILCKAWNVLLLQDMPGILNCLHCSARKGILVLSFFLICLPHVMYHSVSLCDVCHAHAILHISQLSFPQKRKGLQRRSADPLRFGWKTNSRMNPGRLLRRWEMDEFSTCFKTGLTREIACCMAFSRMDCNKDWPSPKRRSDFWSFGTDNDVIHEKNLTKDSMRLDQLLTLGIFLILWAYGILFFATCKLQFSFRSICWILHCHWESNIIISHTN